MSSGLGHALEDTVLSASEPGLRNLALVGILVHRVLVGRRVLAHTGTVLLLHALAVRHVEEVHHHGCGCRLETLHLRRLVDWNLVDVDRRHLGYRVAQRFFEFFGLKDKRRFRARSQVIEQRSINQLGFPLVHFCRRNLSVSGGNASSDAALHAFKGAAQDWLQVWVLPQVA